MSHKSLNKYINAKADVDRWDYGTPVTHQKALQYGEV